MKQLQKQQLSQPHGSVRNQNGMAANAESAVIGRLASNTSSSQEFRSTIVSLADHDDILQQSRPNANNSYRSQPTNSSLNNQIDVRQSTSPVHTVNTNLQQQSSTI